MKMYSHTEESIVVLVTTRDAIEILIWIFPSHFGALKDLPCSLSKKAPFKVSSSICSGERPTDLIHTNILATVCWSLLCFCKLISSFATMIHIFHFFCYVNSFVNMFSFTSCRRCRHHHHHHHQYLDFILNALFPVTNFALSTMLVLFNTSF